MLANNLKRINAIDDDIQRLLTNLQSLYNERTELFNATITKPTKRIRRAKASSLRTIQRSVNLDALDLTADRPLSK